jgi:hypothetical protein
MRLHGLQRMRTRLQRLRCLRRLWVGGGTASFQTNQTQARRLNLLLHLTSRMRSPLND